MKDSDTPRTDECERENGLRCSCADRAFDISRQLEIELNAAVKERDELLPEVETIRSRDAALRAIIDYDDELQDLSFEELVKALVGRAIQYRNQRDEALECLREAIKVIESTPHSFGFHVYLTRWRKAAGLDGAQ